MKPNAPWTLVRSARRWPTFVSWQKACCSQSGSIRAQTLQRTIRLRPRLRAESDRRFYSPGLPHPYRQSTPSLRRAERPQTTASRPDTSSSARMKSKNSRLCPTPSQPSSTRRAPSKPSPSARSSTAQQPAALRLHRNRDQPQRHRGFPSPRGNYHPRPRRALSGPRATRLLPRRSGGPRPPHQPRTPRRQTRPPAD